MKNFLQDMDDEMLVKYLLNQASDGEKERVQAWIAANPANAKYYSHFQLIWEKSKMIAMESTIDEDAAWSKFKHRLSENREPARIITIKSNYRRLMLAAGIVFTVGISALIYYLSNPVSAPVVLAANDAVLTDTLPDKSVITLNKHAELTYQESSGATAARRATLKGEAFFNIKPDKSRPFKVMVDSIEVSVVGTSFNIKNTVDSTVIIVESGIVNVKKNHLTIQLNKGETLTVPRIGSIPAKRNTTDRLHNYYRSREFVCDNTPLWKLVEVLNEAYETRLILANRSVRNSPYTATFHNQPLDRIAGIIAETFELSLTKTGDTIILK